MDMKTQPSVMDAEVNWKREPSSMDLEVSCDTDADFESRLSLRKDPTLIPVTSLKGELSVMDVEMKGKTSSVTDLAVVMSEEPSSINQCENLRTEQTVVMSEKNMTTDKESFVLDVEMGTLNFTQTDTMMSLGDEKSVMDTNNRTDCADAEMHTRRQEMVDGIEMCIKKEPPEEESDSSVMKETATLEADMTIKTEPSFFGTAFDSEDSTPPGLQEMASEEKMSMRVSSPQIKLEPGMSVVEDYADCADTPVPLLRARYTVTSGAFPRANTSSVFREKLVVKLKKKAASKSKYHPFSRKGKRLQAKPNRELESIPTSADSEMVIKCEPVTDGDWVVQGSAGDESFKRETDQKKPRKRGARRKSPPVCSHCQQNFCSRSSLKRHYKRKHSVESLSFSCSYCEAKFSRLIQLRAHERLHRGGDKTFPCQECDVVFTRACHLKVHMRKHTGERPYACSVTDCRATFRSTSNLNRHMMKHSGLRPYVCTVCDANFYQSSHLVSHIRKHTGERPFKCTQCEATFTQLTHLHRHRIRHTGKKPYQCSTCGVGFIEKCSLTWHMRTHAKPLQADGARRLKTKKRNVASEVVSAQQSSSVLS